MKIQLDTVIDDNGNELFEFLIENNILMEVITWKGPAGGHPLIEYNGTRKAIVKLMAEIFEMTPDEIDWNIENQ